MNLEHYLQQATHGLWGRKKQLVREELEAHILERAHKHELSGLSRDQAIQVALEELGTPLQIAQGFLRARVAMVLPRTLLFLMILGGFVLLPWTQDRTVVQRSRMPSLMPGVSIHSIPLAEPGQMQVRALPLARSGMMVVRPIPTSVEKMLLAQR